MLATSGYALMAVTNSVWEFKAGASELARIEDHYKPKAQRSIELHFASPAMTSETRSPPSCTRERTHRAADDALHWGGQTFPALSDGDQFVGQAMHIFKHLCSGSHSDCVAS